jgi:hypothetical protein
MCYCVNWELLIFQKGVWCERHQTPFGVVEETWIYVLNYWFFKSMNVWDYKFSN